MGRPTRFVPQRRETRVVDRVLAERQASVLDMLDRLLDKGVIADGDLTLGVAGVDLIYVRLAAILCAADRVLPRGTRLVTSRKPRKPKRARR
jgi:hypothetical protein